MSDVILLNGVIQIVTAAGCAGVALWAFATAAALPSAKVAMNSRYRVLALATSAAAISTVSNIIFGQRLMLLGTAISALGALAIVWSAIYLWREIVSRRDANGESDAADVGPTNFALVRSVDEARRRLRDIADISGDWIWQTDERLEFTYVSEGIRNLQGASPSAYLGKHLLDFADRSTDAAVDCVARMAEKKPFRNSIVRSRDAVGEMRIVSISGTPLFDDAGGFTGFHGLGSDITTEYRLQEERATTGAKDMFLASMSHEIRTPLNGVLGILEILGETRLSDDQRQLVSTATASGDSLLHLINDILDFSKIQAGRFELTPTDADIVAVVRSAADSLQSLAAKKGNAIKFVVDGTLPSCLIMDGSRFRQVAINLIGNAIKFTKDGTITVNLKKISDDGQLMTVRASVTDTGIGIPGSRQARLFKEFSMLEDPSRMNTNGTGLGLALSKKLMEAMGGRIGVESREGVGSTFWFEAAFQVGAAPVAAVAETVTVSQPEAAARSIKILMAEDNPTNALVTHRMLGAERFLVTHVTNGQDAVAQFKAGTFDVILMDVSMPVMDGMTATQLIRKFERASSRAATPIIALTAHALVSERERILSSGMTSMISKPVRKAALLQELQKHVANIGQGELRVGAKSTAETGLATAQVAKTEAVACKPAPAHPKLQTLSRSTASRLEGLGPVLDRSVLTTLAEETGDDVTPHLLTAFGGEMKKRSAQLEMAKRYLDVDLLMNTCHAVAGSSGMVGGIRLMRLSKQIEMACQTKPDSKLCIVADVMLAEIAGLLAALGLGGVGNERAQTAPEICST